MTAAQFARVRDYVSDCVGQGAHDALHVARVLHYALILARGEKQVDRDLLVLAALLHDVGRGRESEGRGHAEIGAEMARDFLLREGYAAETAGQVADCVRTHSYHGGGRPESLEAKLLFDADKLDLTGAVGSVRTIQHGMTLDEPVYRTGEDGNPLDAADDSLLGEYNGWLAELSGRFYTRKARELAAAHQRTMDGFFHALIDEVNYNHVIGGKLLEQFLEEE